MLSLSLFLKNLGSSAATRLGSAVLGFLLVVFMARQWGAENFGDYSTTLSFFQLLQQAPLLGLHLLVARDVAARPEFIHRDMATAAGLSVGIALLLALAVGAIGEWLYPARLTAALWLAGLALLPTAMTMVVEMVLVGQERLGLVAAVNIAESAIRLLTMVVLIHLGATLSQIVLAFLSLRIVALLLYMTDGRIRRLLRGWKFDVGRLWFYLRQSPIFCGIMLFSAAFSRFDIIFLSKLTTARDVATYAVATRLFEVALMLPSILMVVLLPVFMRLFTRNRTLLEEFFRLVLRYGFILGLPLAIIAAATSRQIVVGIFGEAFAAAILPLQLLMFCALLMAGNQLMATLLLVFDLQRFDLYGLMVGTCVLTASLLLLIPSFGIAGAASALLLGAFAQFVARILILASRTALRVEGVDVARLIAAGGIMIATIWFAPFPPPVAGLAGLATYGIALWFLQAITASDLQTTKDIFSKSKA